MNQVQQRESENKMIYKVRFDCIVPEKLRLWDECDWSVPPDSLLPFEYGPSSEETAGRYGRAVMEHCGDMQGNSAAEG